MESLLIIVGPPIMASLWVAAGFIVGLELAEMYKDIRGI